MIDMSLHASLQLTFVIVFRNVYGKPGTVSGEGRRKSSWDCVLDLFPDKMSSG